MSTILSESNDLFGPASPEACGETVESAVAALKSEIRTLGDQVDSYKARTAGAFGAAVFLLLLAGGGFYDLMTHNNSIRSAIGISLEIFQGVVVVLGALGLFLATAGLLRHLRRDLELERRLERLEHELADHLDRLSQLDPVPDAPSQILPSL